ncbi:uncharacterized protein LOC123967341 isoform X2 [Micropterus dolomieu]|uniref:uncharacterized protein LOC123967341 isoform X2 n=2 Tax=Micropterus TaxID=27705 RepID=UPI001E8D6A2C|nr:uncharacterized protein LOC123967341 isoform X2 [Micropterus dolomieu]
MEKQMLMSAVLRYFRMVVLLLLVSCSWPLFRSPLAVSNALHNLGDFTYPYGSIFSPLLKALSEHGGSGWNTGLKRKMKPEQRYMKYLTQVYKKSSRVQRSLDGITIYNTVRLIKPQDECLAQTHKDQLVNMGRHFGDLAKVRHIITYSLSPFEQRAFPNYFSKGIPNVWRRFSTSFFKVAPPMILMYLTYSWGNSVHQQSKRKNPADFENDE